MLMPEVLTGRVGEVYHVSQWPLRDAQVLRAWKGHARYTDACDAMIHFDQIRIGGKHNARRVRYDGRNYYVTIRNVKVWIDGDLLARVLRVVTCVYGVRGRKDDRDENSA